jgi:Predicted permease
MTPKILAEPNNLWWFIPAAVVIALLYFLSPILAPFLFAAILAYISNPLVSWLKRHRVPRTLGAVLVMLLLGGLFVLLLLILLPLFIKEVRLLSERLPGFLAQLNDNLAPWIKARFGAELQFDLAGLKKLVNENLQGADGLGMKLPRSGSAASPCWASWSTCCWCRWCCSTCCATGTLCWRRSTNCCRGAGIRS